MKPLYYQQKKYEKKFFFSSSIKALLLSADKKEINNNALNFYSNFGRNDDIETIFKGIFKLLPGEVITWKDNSIEKKKILELKISKKDALNNILLIMKDGEIISIIKKIKK